MYRNRAVLDRWRAEERRRYTTDAGHPAACRTSDDVQIDHIVPLAYTWRVGAAAWTDQQREAFSNDPAELRAVDGPTNASKRDRGPSRWLPLEPGCALRVRHCLVRDRVHVRAQARPGDTEPLPT
jgi:hypothetical protein